MALVVAGLLLADLGAGMGFAPRATAQSASAYHWARKRSHFRLRVGNNVKGDWNRYLRGALDEWNQNDTVTLIEVEGTTNPQYCDPVAGTVQVCDWWYGTQTGWLGLARLYFNNRGDHIDAATVQLNNSFLYARNSRYNSDAARRHTICHELGHTLGLDHVGTTSCANDSQYAVFTYLTPLNDDFRQLRRIYEHADASTTVARAQEADLNLFDSTSWPEPDSEEDVMALPLDEETAVLTFVIWADEAVLAESAAATDVVTETDFGAVPYAEDPEAEMGLDSTITDTDADSVADTDEITIYGTDPLVWDTDGDGLSDGEELFAAGTDPLAWDTDGDGVSDGEEVQAYGTNPRDPASFPTP